MMKIEISGEAEDLMKKMGDKFLIDITVCERDKNQLEVMIFRMELNSDGEKIYECVEMFNTGD